MRSDWFAEEESLDVGAPRSPKPPKIESILGQSVSRRRNSLRDGAPKEKLYLKFAAVTLCPEDQLPQPERSTSCMGNSPGVYSTPDQT
jgi:hypothetical protein